MITWRCVTWRKSTLLEYNWQVNIVSSFLPYRPTIVRLEKQVKWYTDALSNRQTKFRISLNGLKIG